MVTSLAAQSIQIKCKMNKSVMTGNYEFYYACGIYSKIKGIQIEAGLKPDELYAKVEETAKNESSDSLKIAYLAKMIYEYRVENNYDEQMEELFDMGLSDAEDFE